MEIRTKKYQFNFRKKWFNDSSLLTYLGNANSIIIELAEDLFTRVIKSIGEKITDSDLKEDVSILLAQESWHKYNHQNFNAQIGKYYDLTGIVTGLRTSLLTASTKIKKIENRVLLCYCFEKFAGRTSTAVICRLLNNSDPVVKDFWEWHKLEEYEHKDTVNRLYKYYDASLIKSFIFQLFFVKWYITNLARICFELYKQDKEHYATV
jgi:predicted metal-dependent hydrolase